MSPFDPFRGGVAKRGQCPLFLPFFFSKQEEVTGGSGNQTWGLYTKVIRGTGKYWGGKDDIGGPNQANLKALAFILWCQKSISE